ncbi:MAG: DUF4241 domain-containing protein [Campylobacteraceae bacterium]
MSKEKEWFRLWEEKRDLLLCPTNLNEYFEKQAICGKNLEVMNIGKVSIPTGEIVVCDPLAYLNKKANPYFLKTPTGEFDVELSVIKESDGDCARYASARVIFNNEKIARLEEALIGNEDLKKFQQGEYFGFNVDAGLASIIDKEVLNSLCDFEENFMKNNKIENMYDDYYAALFSKSYKENPKHQRSGGDYISFKIPNTSFHVPYFQSGFGDGTYPVYFGLDKDDNVCALFIQFIDIELAYGDEE